MVCYLSAVAFFKAESTRKMLYYLLHIRYELSYLFPVCMVLMTFKTKKINSGSKFTWQAFIDIRINKASN